MPGESIRLSAIIPATPLRIYEAWLDGDDHSNFTGAMAEVDPNVGGKFTAWDGYIGGKTLELDPPRRIVQSWRTDEFPADAPFSRVTVELDEVIGGTRITLIHEDIPEGQGGKYEDGWKDFYFKPMKKYFGEVNESEETAKTPLTRVRAKPEAVADDEVTTREPVKARKASAKKKPAKKVKAVPAKKSKPAAKKKSPAKKKAAAKTARKPAPKKKAAGNKQPAGKKGAVTKRGAAPRSKVGAKKKAAKSRKR